MFNAPSKKGQTVSQPRKSVVVFRCCEDRDPDKSELEYLTPIPDGSYKVRPLYSIVWKKVQMKKGNKTMPSKRNCADGHRWAEVGWWGWDDGTLSTGFDGTDKSVQRPAPLIGRAWCLLHPPLVALNNGGDCEGRLSVPVSSVFPLFITTATSTTTTIVWSG